MLRKEPEMAAAEVDQAILLHSGKFPGKCAAIHVQVFSHSSPVKRDAEGTGACLFGLLEKVSQYLVTDGGLYKTIVAIV